MDKIGKKVGKLTLEKVKAAIAFDQPKLSAREEGGVFILEGKFLVAGNKAVHPAGPITEFEVKILVFDTFPWDEPIVFEVGERIPKHEDRHIYTRYGNCCVTVWESWLVEIGTPSFQDYLNGPLRQFFLSQYYFEENEEWPLGEFSHGDEGLYEAFADALRVKNETKPIINYLRVLSQSWPKGHNPCPCGSGKIIRRCCQKELMALHHKVSPRMAKRMLKRLGGPRKK